MEKLLQVIFKFFSR